MALDLLAHQVVHLFNQGRASRIGLRSRMLLDTHTIALIDLFGQGLVGDHSCTRVIFLDFHGVLGSFKLGIGVGCVVYHVRIKRLSTSLTHNSLHLPPTCLPFALFAPSASLNAASLTAASL